MQHFSPIAGNVSKQSLPIITAFRPTGKPIILIFRDQLVIKKIPVCKHKGRKNLYYQEIAVYLANSTR